MRYFENDAFSEILPIRKDVYFLTRNTVCNLSIWDTLCTCRYLYILYNFPYLAQAIKRFLPYGTHTLAGTRELAKYYRLVLNMLSLTQHILLTEKSPPSARKPAITRRLAANATVKQKSSAPSIKGTYDCSSSKFLRQNRVPN